MPSLAILGATGNLGSQVARQAIAGGWQLSVAVRNRSRLDPEIAAKARVTDLDLATASTEAIAAFARDMTPLSPAPDWSPRGGFCLPCFNHRLRA